MTQPSAPPAEIAARKAAIRKAALGARALIDAATRLEAAHAIADFGGAVVAREKPERVSLFFSVKGEIDTGPLAGKLAQAGVPLCLPVIVGKGEPLVFRDWRPGDPLDDRPFGLKEPPESAAEVVPDLLFVPLAAFDRLGGRVGYGGGFYDRTLDKLRSNGGRAVAIGLAFATQEVACAPVAAHDALLEWILTERELIACLRQAS
jgi:5-formyltetrahydrofolate cyclo-ligase